MKGLSTFLALGAAAILVVGQTAEADARGRGGGGARGGGSMGMSRGGGGGGSMSRSSGSRSSAGTSNRASTGTRQSPGTRAGVSDGGRGGGDRQGDRQAAQGDRQGDRQANQGDRQSNRETSQGDRQDGRTDRQETRQTERTDRQNTRQGERTDRQGNRTDAFEDGDWDNGWGGWVDNPIAAGMVIGATAMWTSAVIGSYYYGLPYGCPAWGWGGASYYSCGGSYYQPIYEGDTVVYVTVPDPSNGQQAPGPMEPPGELAGPPAPPAQ
jgi:hypothetical protein